MIQKNGPAAHPDWWRDWLPAPVGMDVFTFISSPSTSSPGGLDRHWRLSSPSAEESASVIQNGFYMTLEYTQPVLLSDSIVLPDISTQKMASHAAQVIELSFGNIKIQ